MKFFAFIMAVLVLVLGCIPCMDGTVMLKKPGSKTEIAKSADQSEQNHTDACSPFCTCNCCATFAFVFPAFQINIFNVSSSENIAEHLLVKITAIALPVWQPPQLV